MLCEGGEGGWVEEGREKEWLGGDLWGGDFQRDTRVTEKRGWAEEKGGGKWTKRKLEESGKEERF